MPEKKNKIFYDVKAKTRKCAWVHQWVKNIVTTLFLYYTDPCARTQ